MSGAPRVVAAREALPGPQPWPRVPSLAGVCLPQRPAPALSTAHFPVQQEGSVLFHCLLCVLLKREIWLNFSRCGKRGGAVAQTHVEVLSLHFAWIDKGFFCLFVLFWGNERV